MTSTPDLGRRHVGRAASALHVPRPLARAILALPTPLRVDLFSEVARVGVGRVLAFTRTQPSIPPTHEGVATDVSRRRAELRGPR